MPARVYVFNPQDSAKVKKLMEYDPYLDTSIIPPQKDIKEKDLAKLSPEARKKIEEENAVIEANVLKLKSDPEANVIFARQDYKIRDGSSVGLSDDKGYLYISANDEFMAKVEPKLKKNIEGIERAAPDIEAKIISVIETEQSESEQGIGSIFG